LAGTSLDLAVEVLSAYSNPADGIRKLRTADAEECIFPRGGGKAVVIVSLDEWNAVNETLPALGSATNARRLLEGIAQAESR
jgi:PHD/YefM family antitoxin component YafN of YafNO toxin-antitoxin module